MNQRAMNQLSMNQLAIEDAEHAARSLSLLLVMRNHDDRCAVFGTESGKNVHDFVTHVAIEVSRGLIGKKDSGVADDRAGYGDPLLLSTRKLGRKVPHPRA